MADIINAKIYFSEGYADTGLSRQSIDALGPRQFRVNTNLLEPTVFTRIDDFVIEMVLPRIGLGFYPF